MCNIFICGRISMTKVGKAGQNNEPTDAMGEGKRVTAGNIKHVG